MAQLTVIVILLAAATSFVVSYFAVSIVRKMASALGLLDKPGHRKVHTVPVPLGGGLGVWFGMVVTFAIGTAFVFWIAPGLTWLPKSVEQYLPGAREKSIEIWVLLGGGTILMLLGLADDRRGISWKLRLAIEFVVAGTVVYWQGLQLTAFIDSPFITSLLSVFWIVLLINSFNMLDNMDALSGGVAAISSSMLGIMLLISFQSGHSQLFVAAMLFILVGALLGFLCHNWPPARIFMGDAGSYLVGYWIAISTLLATYSEYQSKSPFAVLAPLCVLAIPLYDTFSVIWIRLREGRSPFEGDKRHFSHRLVDLGFTKQSAVWTIYLATLTCSLSALILPRTDFLGAIFCVVLVGCILLMVAVLEQRHRTTTNSSPPTSPKAEEKPHGQ